MRNRTGCTREVRSKRDWIRTSMRRGSPVLGVWCRSTRCRSDGRSTTWSHYMEDTHVALRDKFDGNTISSGDVLRQEPRAAQRRKRRCTLRSARLGSTCAREGVR